MIKNENFTPSTVNTRNEMIEAIERNEKVIYIEGEACKELDDEINKQIKECKSSKRWGRMSIFGGLGTGAILVFAIPGIGWTIGGIALAVILSGIGSSVLDGAGMGDITNKYYLAYDEVGSSVGKAKRYVLIQKDYSFEYHSLTDNCVLTADKECPKCKKKYNKKTMTCDGCGKHIILVKKK